MGTPIFEREATRAHTDAVTLAIPSSSVPQMSSVADAICRQVANVYPSLLSVRSACEDSSSSHEQTPWRERAGPRSLGTEIVAARVPKDLVCRSIGRFSCHERYLRSEETVKR